MEISLIRHGKSKLTENHPITCTEFRKWVEKYNVNGVFEESYPSNTLGKMTKANLVLTSDLERSIESAKLLSPNVETISVPLFRETELPIPLTTFWGIKLEPNVWAVILRCLWFGGLSTGCESIREAKFRAEQASQLLVEYASNHETVVLVGHGFFNRMIAKELQRMGWKGKQKISSTHWNCTTYSYFS